VKLVQFQLPTGDIRVGVLQGDEVIDITSEHYHGVTELITAATELGQDLDTFLEAYVPAHRGPSYSYDELLNPPHSGQGALLLPLFPPEVWGCGVTYKRSAEFRDHDTGQEKGIYDRVYESERPEIFFKGTARCCVGHGDAVGVRRDSQVTATEPELAYVINRHGHIVGYTVCNDVSAWDLERENPLYLPQSKMYDRCCALGPVLATPGSIPDPYNLEITCRIQRDGQYIFEDRVSSSRIGRKFEQLTEFLLRDNGVPDGTVVSTGTGIMVPNEFALQHGDVVEIEIEGIGLLSNPVQNFGYKG
jgi:2-dehydro-3-deoxy-D-arabinonate dehydratase